MRLTDQIRAVACVCWAGTLGLGMYVGAQDAPQPAGSPGFVGESRSAEPGDNSPLYPGAALLQGDGREKPEAGVDRSAGDSASAVVHREDRRKHTERRVPPRPGFACCSRNHGRDGVGSTQGEAFEGGAAWSRGQRKSADEAARSKSREDTHGTLGTPGKPQSRPATGIKPSRHLQALESYQPFVATAYAVGCILPKFGPEPPAQRMASGEWPIAGLHVAADPSIAFGTVIEAVWHGLPSRLIVGDRGRAIRGRRLDLFVRDCDTARAWGRRTVMARVVGE